MTTLRNETAHNARYSLFALMAALFVAAAAPASVHAADFTAPAAGAGVIGQIGSEAWWAIAPANGGPCVFRFLGAGGLTTSTKLHGTNGADTIILYTTTTDFCGFTIQPLLRNGHSLVIDAHDGDDNIFQLSTEAAITYAGAGNDYCANLGGNFSTIYGNSGNDRLTGRSYVNVFAGGGNDRITIQSGQQANLVEGDTGFDTLCGAALVTTGIDSTAGC